MYTILFVTFLIVVSIFVLLFVYLDYEYRQTLNSNLLFLIVSMVLVITGAIGLLFDYTPLIKTLMFTLKTVRIFILIHFISAAYEFLSCLIEGDTVIQISAPRIIFSEEEKEAINWEEELKRGSTFSFMEDAKKLLIRAFVALSLNTVAIYVLWYI